MKTLKKLLCKLLCLLGLKKKSCSVCPSSLAKCDLPAKKAVTKKAVTKKAPAKKKK